MEAKYFQLKKSKKKGLDEESALRMVGGGPVMNFYAKDMLTRPNTKMADYAGAMSVQERPQRYSSTVRRVRKKGRGLVQIEFKDHKYTYEEAYGCRETNKVDRITRDGQIIYRETGCKYRKRSETRKGHPPVLVPAFDARGVKPGDVVTGVYVGQNGTRRGYVMKVLRGKKDQKTIQIRGHRLN